MLGKGKNVMLIVVFSLELAKRNLVVPGRGKETMFDGRDKRSKTVSVSEGKQKVNNHREKPVRVKANNDLRKGIFLVLIVL